jgi:hypothetical protein
MSADTKIRARAILFLMRNGVEFDKDISNSMLVVLIKLFWQSVKDAKEIAHQKKMAMVHFDNLTPNGWIHVNKLQVKEIMEQTGGAIVKYNLNYWISFRPVLKAVSHFVFQKSGCKDGDYYVSLADRRTHHPYRDWK